MTTRTMLEQPAAAEVTVDRFLKRFKMKSPLFYREIERNLAVQRELFYELAAPMLQVAGHFLGDGYEDILIDGYCTFVIDVNRSQARYEVDRRYLHSSFDKVYRSAYGDDDFMRLYHWGVFVTTFAWRHHLRIYRMYRDAFLPRLEEQPGGRLLDLGAGSGIWHLIAYRARPSWCVTAVDISPHSVETSRTMIQSLEPGAPIEHVCSDATTFELDAPADAGVCCFLLEHLEHPDRLLRNLSRNLRPGAYSFVTCAITAAEYDHIYEYTHESQAVLQAEENGFRVLETMSVDSGRTPEDKHYLPRSMALLLQKRRGDIW